MYTIQSRSIAVGGETIVLRVVNKPASFKHSAKLPKHRPYNLGLENLPPGTNGKTFAWLEERTEGGTRPLTDRISLARLPHMSRLVKWIADVRRAPVGDELSKHLDLLLAWRWIQQDSVNSALHRMYRDVLTALAAKQVPSRNSRVRRLCDEYGAATKFSDSSDVTEILFGLNCLLREHDLYRLHPSSKRHAPGTRPLEVAKESEPHYWAGLNEYLEYLSGYEHLSSSWIHRGQLLSYLGERSAAIDSFRHAIELNGDLVERCGSDLGAFTYGAPPVPTENKAAREIAFLGQVKTGADEDFTAKATVLYSGNITFLRNYMPRILYYASALRDFRYHVHLIDGVEQCSAFIEESNDLLSSILKMRGMASSSVQLAWSREDLPDHVGNPKTYYACARFLQAENVMSHYGGSVWIQDADVFPTAPTDIFDTQLGRSDVTLNQTRFLHGLVPWKRFLAGSVYLNDTQAARTFLQEASRYIESYLALKQSWTLDQNALDWAVQCTRGHTRVGDGYEIGIPLTQTAMSRYLEQ